MKAAHLFTNASISPKVRLTLAEEIKLWERRINRSENFYQIIPGKEEELVAMLTDEDDIDSYLTSPVYYSYTGRQGLWIYRERDAFIPLCWHPNVPGQILVFPSRGTENPQITGNLLSSIPEPPGGLRMVRLKKDQLNNKLSGTAVLAPVVEQVLDWKYPVKILSTKKVALLKGHHFKRIRNHIRCIDGRGVKIKTLDIKDRASLESFIEKWVATYQKNDYAQFIAPYHKLLDMLESRNFKLEGLVFVIDDKIQAITVWDVSNSKTQTANRFVNLCNMKYRGLADFVMHRVAKTLYEQGILFMNLGGSERIGLDQFKNKFMPEVSLQLSSADVLIDEDSSYIETSFPEYTAA